jgi:hypothetical protein
MDPNGLLQFTLALARKREKRRWIVDQQFGFIRASSDLPFFSR